MNPEETTKSESGFSKKPKCSRLGLTIEYTIELGPSWFCARLGAFDTSIRLISLILFLVILPVSKYWIELNFELMNFLELILQISLIEYFFILII